MPQDVHSPVPSEHGKDRSDSSELVENAMELAEKLGEKREQEPHCDCHASEKKSTKMASIAAAFSIGAFLLSIASIALPFLRKADDVTFDAAAWAEFLSTMEEQIEETEPTPAPSASVPNPVRPKPVVTTQTPTPTPTESAPADTAPAEEAPIDATPVEETPSDATGDTGTPNDGTTADATTPNDVAAADAGTSKEEPIAADGSRQ